MGYNSKNVRYEIRNLEIIECMIPENILSWLGMYIDIEKYERDYCINHDVQEGNTGVWLRL